MGDGGGDGDGSGVKQRITFDDHWWRLIRHNSSEFCSFSKPPGGKCSAVQCSAVHIQRRSVQPPYMTKQFPLSAAWSGLWLFSISPIISSKERATFSSARALASVQAQENSWPSAFPSSGVTWRCEGARSDLLPMMTSGTDSEPCQKSNYSVSNLQLVHLFTW